METDIRQDTFAHLRLVRPGIPMRDEMAIENEPKSYWYTDEGLSRVLAFFSLPYGTLKLLNSLHDKYGTQFISEILLAAACKIDDDKAILHIYNNELFGIVKFVYSNCPELLSALVNRQDSNGKTLVHKLPFIYIACDEAEEGRAMFLELLAMYIDCGADLSIQDKNYETPFEAAIVNYPKCFPEGQASADQIIAEATERFGCYGAATKSAAAANNK